MDDSSVRAEIIKKLREIEVAHDVKIILAIETGSRAYGLDSLYSDYDVRFIYAHRRDWYLSIALEEQRDTIEFPLSDKLDLNGWDLRKSLRLFWKSNPGFIEWIQSDKIYGSSGSFQSQAQNLLPLIYSIENGIHHYRNMAFRNQKECNIEHPISKSYLQALRATLSMLWIEENQSPAPTNFKKLYSSLNLSPEFLADILDLVVSKRSGIEATEREVYNRVHHFILTQINKPRSHPQKIKRSNVEPMLSNLFRSTLSELWS